MCFYSNFDMTAALHQFASLFILFPSYFALCVSLCPLWQKEKAQGKRKMDEGTGQQNESGWKGRSSKQNSKT